MYTSRATEKFLAKCYTKLVKGMVINSETSRHKVRVEVVSVLPPTLDDSSFRFNVKVVGYTVGKVQYDGNGSLIKDEQGIIKFFPTVSKLRPSRNLRYVNSNVKHEVRKELSSYSEIFSIPSYRLTVSKIDWNYLEKQK